MVLIVRRAATIGCWAVIVAASLLAMSSYVAYTTVGFDFEIPTARGVDVFYYRLRWDDGSTWAGLAVQPRPHPARALDWFDPGGTILARPTRPVHRHRCNDLGFWWINSPADDPYVAARYHGATFSTWWGCPSWLVLLLFWVGPLWRVASRRGERHTDATEKGKNMSTENRIEKPIIFFDDVCGMCNTFVNLILRVDRKRTFLFAPLNGSTARDFLPPLAEDPREWSMVYVDEAGIHDQSDASLEVYRRLGGAWRLLGLLKYVPRAIRNPAYRVLARNRYRWFGKRDTCRVPTAEERQRFLP